jgi:riboflavin transporter FmnP
MLPYTSLLTGRIEHVLPAVLLVWAVLLYRHPILAGSLIGFASGVVYYPFFLLPLWLSFYWHRGFRRFLTSYAITVTALALVLFVFSPNHLVPDLTRMFGLSIPAMMGLGGIWNPAAGGWDVYYRIPVLAAFVVLSISMALWPAQKNLGTLLSCSAAIMVAAQFWHGYGGGTYMAWYLPLTLLTIFRPNLEDRVAVTVLDEGWFPKLASLPKAA